jgi:hypothetical protein
MQVGNQVLADSLVADWLVALDNMGSSLQRSLGSGSIGRRLKHL